MVECLFSFIWFDLIWKHHFLCSTWETVLKLVMTSWMATRAFPGFLSKFRQISPPGIPISIILRQAFLCDVIHLERSTTDWRQDTFRLLAPTDVPGISLFCCARVCMCVLLTPRLVINHRGILIRRYRFFYDTERENVNGTREIELVKCHNAFHMAPEIAGEGVDVFQVLSLYRHRYWGQCGLVKQGTTR